jgi:hypothetical protein
MQCNRREAPNIQVRELARSGAGLEGKMVSLSLRSCFEQLLIEDSKPIGRRCGTRR